MSIALNRIHYQLTKLEDERIELSKAMQDCDGRGAAIAILQKEVARIDEILKAAYMIEIPNEIADKIKIW